MRLVVLDKDGNEVRLPTTTEIPSWLRRSRSERKFSMQDIADLLGVSKQAVHYWETGLVSPNPDNLTKLVAIFSGATKKLEIPKKSKMDAIDALLRPHAKNVDS